MEILNETRCHSETIRCHWWELYLRHNSAHFNVSSFLDLYTASKGLAHKSESFTKGEHLLALENFHHPISLSLRSHPGIFDPITEEHTKLLDRLSGLHLTYPSCLTSTEEEVSTEVVTACLSASGFTVCQLRPYFCKRAFLSSQLLRNRSEVNFFQTPAVLTSLLCRLRLAYDIGFRRVSDSGFSSCAAPTY